MQLTPLEKSIVIKILQHADGEDLDEIIDQTHETNSRHTNDWILRLFFLRADAETIMNLLKEKLSLCSTRS